MAVFPRACGVRGTVQVRDEPMTIVTLEDLQTRSQFVRELASHGCAYVVEGADGYARVPSPRRQGHEVELMWTSREEAVRWADALVEQPKITAMPLEVLLSRHLPKLAEEGRLLGVNWSDAPSEPEIAANDLDAQVRRQLVTQFVDAATRTRQVWVLKIGDQPVTIVTRHPAGGEALPVFTDRASADRAIAGDWNQAAAARIPISDFLQKAVIWCVETRRRIAPAYIRGPGLVELHAWEMKAMLSGHMPTRRVA